MLHPPFIGLKQLPVIMIGNYRPLWPRHTVSWRIWSMVSAVASAANPFTVAPGLPGGASPSTCCLHLLTVCPDFLHLLHTTGLPPWRPSYEHP